MILKRAAKEWQLHLLLVPSLILVFIFCYIPMAGVYIAFEKFAPNKGIFDSPFVGWENFNYLFEYPDFHRIIVNTVFIAVMKIAAGMIVPVAIAILLNEIGKTVFKRFFQTLVYLPHFLSWVLLGGILIDILSPSTGIVNQVLGAFGISPIYFLGDNRWFPYVMVVSDTWKEFGFSAIIYLAALTGINPSLYEAAHMDGASWLRRSWHITLPGIRPILILMLTLSIGNVLNAGFDQIFNLYSPQVYESGDIIDTFVYRTGLVESQYGFATAVGLFKSLVSFVLISASYLLAYRLANHRIF